MRSAETSTDIAAPIDRVWSAWADPTELARWYPDRATGTLAAGHHLTWIWDCYGMDLDLEVLAAEPPRRLLLRADPSGRGPQHQEVHLEPTPTGTRVHLTHDGFPDTPRGHDERAGTEAGWTTALATLRHYLEHYPGRDRATAALLTDLHATPEQVFARLASYPRPPGHLLSETPPYELAYTWPALDAIVTLRSFTLGGQPTARLAGAHLSTWTPDSLDRGRSQVFRLLEHLTADIH